MGERTSEVVAIASQYPTRHNTHNLEEISERFFVRSLPRNWTWERSSRDYGVDLRVEIFEDQSARGLELLVQLKASRKSTSGPSESARLRVSTYNYLWDKLQVVMLIKYIEEVDEAYWFLMKDIPTPNQERETFTVHIPKENTLSTINWNEIQAYIREVTVKKLAVRRRVGPQRPI